MDAGVIAVRLVVRHVVDEAVALALVHFRMDIGITRFVIPLVVDLLLPRQLKAPLVLFVEVFRFRVAGRAVPADDVFQIAVENAAFEARLGTGLILEAQGLGIAFFRLQVFVAVRRRGNVELVVQAGRRKDAAP